MSRIRTNPFRTTPLDNWFLVRVTAVIAGTPQSYTFVEWHSTGDTDGDPLGSGPWKIKTGGRIATTLNPGYAVPANGSGAAGTLGEITFNVGDFAKARPADGAGGLSWEMVPIPQRRFPVVLTTQDPAGMGWKWKPLYGPVIPSPTVQLNVFNSEGTESSTYSAFQFQQEKLAAPLAIGSYGLPTGGELVWLDPLGDGTYAFELTYTTAYEWKGTALSSSIGLSSATPSFVIGCVSVPAAGPYRVHYSATGSIQAVDKPGMLWIYSADGYPLFGGGAMVAYSEPHVDGTGTSYTTAKTVSGSASKSFIFNAAGPTEVVLYATIFAANSTGGIDLTGSASNSASISIGMGAPMISADRLDSAVSTEISPCTPSGSSGSGSGISPPPPPPPPPPCTGTEFVQPNCCPGTCWPATLTTTISGGTGGAADINGTYTMTGGWGYSGPSAGGGGTVNLLFGCTADGMELRLDYVTVADGSNHAVATALPTCDPLSVSGSATFSDGVLIGQSINWSVTP